ncbi:MAG: 50S ribosomal protein L29 [Patescibacteria group bacterium]
MKTKFKQELRQKSLPELASLLIDIGKELLELRVKASQGQLVNVRQLSVKKKELALVKTLVSEKQKQNE